MAKLFQCPECRLFYKDNAWLKSAESGALSINPATWKS